MIYFILGKSLPMTIYSRKTQSIRTVSIEPSESWGGQGLLGVSIRFCSFEGANENVWHVLEVHPSSPAEIAGLCSFTDYIIGADSVLHDNEDLFALIEAHEGRSLKLYVYNSAEDTSREVTIVPNSAWGGKGSIGCGIGYGYLHRIPLRGIPQQNTESRSGKANVSEFPAHNVVVNPENVPLCTTFNAESNLMQSPSSPENKCDIKIIDESNRTNFVNTNQENVAPVLNMPPSIVSTPNNNSTNTAYPTNNVIYPYLQPVNVQNNTIPISEAVISSERNNPHSNVFVPPTTIAMNQNYFDQNFQSNVTNHLLFNPDIAARSAQQLLSGERKPV